MKSGKSSHRFLAAVIFLLLNDGILLAQEALAPRRPRVVAPELIPPPAVDPSALIRVPPRAPLTDLGQPTAPESTPTARFFRPVATAAGVVEAEGRTITIAGIHIVPADQLCDSAEGSTWPCGMRARTAFRNWLRGRAVDCPPPEEEASPEMPLKCSVAGNDVGAWLVENGWALSVSGGPYEDEARAAREALRGIFGGGQARSLPAFPEDTEPTPATEQSTLPSPLMPQALP